MDLEALVARADAEKAAVVKEVDTMKTELARLDEQVYKNTSNFGEWVTRWPVLNAALQRQHPRRAELAAGS